MSDQSKLCVEVRLKPNDMYRYSLTTIFHRFRWVIVIFVCLGVYLAVQFSLGNLQWGWKWENLFGPVFFFIIFPYAVFVAPYFSSKKYLERNPNLAGPNTYSFSSDGIDISGAQSSGHLNWEAILEVRETSAQFLLYPQTLMAHVIPKRCIENDDQQALRALIRDHVKNSKLRK